MDNVYITDVLTHRTRMVARTVSICTCNTCGRSWDDSIVTGLTPAPSARCPFEALHKAPKPLKLSGKMRVIELDANQQAIVPDAPQSAAMLGVLIEVEKSLAYAVDALQAPAKSAIRENLSDLRALITPNAPDGDMPADKVMLDALSRIAFEPLTAKRARAIALYAVNYAKGKR